MRTILLTIFFFIGVVFGALYWLLSPLILGKYEPWDYSIALYFIVTSIPGFCFGFMLRKNFWLAILGMYFGQVVVAFLRPQSSGESLPLYVGFLAMALWLSPAIMSSLLGWFLGNAITHKILAFAEKKVISNSFIEAYHGIGICDFNSDKSDDMEFLECTKKALDYIKKTDSLVFNRIKRELKYIVNRELVSGGRFSRLTKSCQIDFGRYKFDLDYDWCFHYYMSTIVHESTHGYIASKGIKYNKGNRGRIEEICEKASARFLRKTSYKKAEDMIGEFDESRWHFYWNASAWEETKIVLKRMRESRQKELERRSHEDSNNVC